MSEDTGRQHPLRTLDEAELEFVLRLVLASGSLKDLAQAYGVSYPTIRAKLDRLIERLQAAVRGRPPDPMSDLLADLIDKGELATATARKVLELHRKELKKLKESSP